MFGARVLIRDRECTLEQRDGLAVPAIGIVKNAKRIDDADRQRVLGAEALHGDRKRSFRKRNGFARIAGLI